MSTPTNSSNMVEDFIAECPTINGPCLAVKDQQIRSPEWENVQSFHLPVTIHESGMECFA